jgi:hypothetical protein
MVHEMIDGKEQIHCELRPHLPNIPVDHAKAFVDAVKGKQKE